MFREWLRNGGIEQVLYDEPFLEGMDSVSMKS